MTREEKIALLVDELEDIRCDFDADTYEDAILKEAVLIIKTLKQLPCDDCIRRQEVLEQINCWIGSGEYKYTNATYYLTRRMQELPPVTPQPNTDVLDKIRAEIEQKCCITVGRENDPAITLYDVFQIIDKYKAESEDK